MSIRILSPDSNIFPDVSCANKDGLLAIGGDLSVPRLTNAYHNGIFPWYNPGEVIQWYSPDPRFVLFPNELKIAKSLKSFLKKSIWDFRMNTAFKDVISNCAAMQRPGQDGSWIGDEIIDAYCDLHQNGIAISAETWEDNELIGGLYGVMVGKVFCGESMFSKKSNASKFAFVNMVNYLLENNFELIDCQLYTDYLDSFGARFISREDYLKFLPKENS